MTENTSTTSPAAAVAPAVNEQLKARIIRQVEYYFGDANLPRDKFLQEQVGKDADGWVPVAVIASFQRMKAITEDLEVLKAAIRGSSQLVELSEEGDMIRRTIPLAQDGGQESLMARSLYVKGFPITATLDDLLAFFGKHEPKPQAIRMRRHPKSKDFKGSVFVEFATEEEAKAFLALENIAFEEGTLLEKCTKMAYFERKNAERQQHSGGNKFEEELERLSKDYVRGCLVKLTGVPSGLPHTEIKAAIGEKFSGDIAFVEQEGVSAWVRLKEAKGEELVASLGQDFAIRDQTITAVLATEEEEQRYYLNLAAVMMSKKASKYGKNAKRSTPVRSSYNDKKRPAEAVADAGVEEKEVDDQWVEVNAKKAREEAPVAAAEETVTEN